MICVWMNAIDDTHEFFRLEFTTDHASDDDIPIAIMKEHNVRFPPRPNRPKPDNREQAEYARACVAAYLSAGEVIPKTAPPKGN